MNSITRSGKVRPVVTDGLSLCLRSPVPCIKDDNGLGSLKTDINECGYDKTKCKTRIEHDKVHIWYVKQYPTVYSKNSSDDRLIENLQTLRGFSGDRLQFIPIRQTRDSESDILTVEYYFSKFAENNVYRFFDIKAPPDIDTGKALCRTKKRPWGESLLDQCIVTRFRNQNGHYVLSLVESKPFWGYVCAQSVRFDVTQDFLLEENYFSIFRKKLEKSLIEGSLKIDPKRLEVEGDYDTGINVFAESGPRISKIIPRYRELIDVTIRFRPHGSIFSAKVRASAYINRQNTDKGGDWHMPEDMYYQGLESMLKEAVDISFSATCQELNLEAGVNENWYQRFKICE